MNLKALPYPILKHGFTLVELLIVIAIIGILSASVVSVINPIQQQKKARDAVRRADLSKISTALEQYYADHNSYPTTVNDVVPNAPEFTSYMRNNVPAEVISDYRYCYHPSSDNQNYVLCSISEAIGDNASSMNGAPCSVLSGSGTEPDRYCVENPF